MKKINLSKTDSFERKSRKESKASQLYNSQLYKKLNLEKESSSIANNISVKDLNRVFTKSSQEMTEIPDNSIHLMITSPPYNVGKDYDQDLDLKSYLNLLKEVFEETYRVLIPGGRACINIANIGRKPYIPLHSHITQLMLGIGFLMRGEVIWQKGASAGASTAWGSWLSASNPVLRDTHEYILIFSKNQLERKKGDRKSTIEKEDFLEWTKSSWKFSTVSAKKIGHPAPFPLELPHRLIQLYSFQKEIVLDPFLGSGTTAIAALKNKRYYLGYEVDATYSDLAKRRIRDSVAQQKLF